MRGRIVAVATILALAFTVVALITPGAAARDRTELFLAKLNGFKEVPGPGGPDGGGKAYITLVNNRACWVLNWFGVSAPTAAPSTSAARPRPARLYSPCSPVLRGCRLR